MGRASGLRRKLTSTRAGIVGRVCRKYNLNGLDPCDSGVEVTGITWKDFEQVTHLLESASIELPTLRLQSCKYTMLRTRQTQKSTSITLRIFYNS